MIRIPGFARVVSAVVLILTSLDNRGPDRAKASAAAAARPAPVASVTAILRSGLLLRAGTARTIAATPFAPLYTGDHVRTAVGQRTAILLRDGSQVLLNENTDLGISFPVMRLYHGEIFARIIHGNNYHVVVSTDSAVAAVRGTQFDLTAGVPGTRADTVLTVSESAVQLSNRLGSVLVQAGEQATVNPNTAPTRPVVVQIAGVTLWTSHVSFSSSIALPPHYRTPNAATNAAAAARTALRAHPRIANARLALADADADLGNTLAARVQYTRALALLAPADRVARARAEVGIASTDLALADWPGTDRAAATAQTLDPSNMQAAMLRGDAALARGDLTAALAWFAEARRRHADAPQPLVAEGLALLLQRQDKRAIDVLLYALTRRPPPWLAASALVDLGALSTFHGALEQALAYDLQAVKADPREALGWIAVGVALVQLGHFKEAVLPFTVASRIGAPFERVTALDDLGDVQYNLGNLSAEAAAYNAAQAVDPNDATASNGVGWTFLARGQYGAAIKAMHRAVTLAPDVVNFSADYARALWAGHQPALAEAVCRQALRREPRNVNVLLVLGFALDSEGKPNAARAAYAAAYAARPSPLGGADDADLAGTLSLNAGHLVEARADLQVATRLHPANYLHWQVLGLILERLKLYREAVHAAGNALALNPCDFISHSILALSYTALHDKSHAKIEYLTLLRLDPHSVGTHAGLATIAEDTGNLYEARDQYLAEIAVLREPQNQFQRAAQLATTWTSLGLVYDGLHDTTKAVDAYRQAIRFDPLNAGYYRLLGIDLKALGKLSDAITAFSRAIALAPKYSAGYSERGGAELSFGRVADAERDYRRAVALSPKDGVARLQLGLILITERKNAEARGQLRVAVVLLHGNTLEAAARGELGIVLDRLGDYSGAAIAHARQIALQPSNTQAHSARGLDLLFSNRLDEARAEFTIVQRQSPNDPSVYLDLALIDDRQGRTTEAIAVARRQIAVNMGRPAYLVHDYRYLGLLLAEHLRWKESVDAFARVIALGGVADSDYYDLGYAQGKAGDKIAALRNLRKAYALAITASHKTQATLACREITALGGVC